MNVIFFGAGIGSIILTVLWIFALFCCFISLHTKYNLGPLVVTVTIFITVVLLSIPRDTEQPPSIETPSKILDPLFVWRTSILLFLGLSAIVSGTIAITSYVMDVKQARPIKHWYIKN